MITRNTLASQLRDYLQHRQPSTVVASAAAVDHDRLRIARCMGDFSGVIVTR